MEGMLARPIAVAPLTTKGFATINFDGGKGEHSKDPNYEGIPKNGSGDNLSTLS